MSEPVFPPVFGKNAIAFFTTRSAGADPGAAARIAGIDPGKVYLPVQKHTDKVHFVDASFEPVVADAVLTARRGILLGVKTADCVPILVCDPVRRVVGAVHAGWRGTASGILAGALRAASERYGCVPENMLVAIGPSIRQCCYEVDPDVAHQVAAAAGEGTCAERRGSKFRLDLQEANRLQARKSGVPPEKIWVSPECTHCLPEKFFSFRYAKVSAARQAGFIMMQ
ncbi:MAG: peptidoglycan editing factor PgeF [Thermodesulfovibrionales bacterium]